MRRVWWGIHEMVIKTHCIHIKIRVTINQHTTAHTTAMAGACFHKFAWRSRQLSGGGPSNATSVEGLQWVRHTRFTCMCAAVSTLSRRLLCGRRRRARYAATAATIHSIRRTWEGSCWRGEGVCEGPRGGYKCCCFVIFWCRAGPIDIRMSVIAILGGGTGSARAQTCRRRRL